MEGVIRTAPWRFRGWWNCYIQGSAINNSCAHSVRGTPRGFAEEYVSSNGPAGDSISLQRDWLYRNAQDLIGVSERASEMADWFERNAGVAGISEAGCADGSGRGIRKSSRCAQPAGSSDRFAVETDPCIAVEA
jgi:hypothetical protein